MDLSTLNTRALADRALDRRSLLKAGAWAAPAIATVTAAPLIAASLDDIVLDRFELTEVKPAKLVMSLSARTTSTKLLAVTVTLTPTGELDAPFTGRYRMTDTLKKAGMQNKKAGKPVGYSGSLTLGARAVQGTIDAGLAKKVLSGTAQSITITLSAPGHLTKMKTVTATLVS